MPVNAYSDEDENIENDHILNELGVESFADDEYPSDITDNESTNPSDLFDGAFNENQIADDNFINIDSSAEELSILSITEEYDEQSGYYTVDDGFVSITGHASIDLNEFESM